MEDGDKVSIPELGKHKQEEAVATPRCCPPHFPLTELGDDPCSSPGNGGLLLPQQLWPLRFPLPFNWG